MSGESIRYLSRKDVETIDLPMDSIIEALQLMFAEKGEGRVEMPPKPGIHTRLDAFIHAMPAYIPKFGAAGIKWISGYPENHKTGLPYISGLLILNDPETGFPVSVMDATWITAMRTGAATAVAARLLARTDSHSAGILGCGVQGRSNLKALACVFDIKVAHVYDIRREVAEAYRNDMSESLGIEITIVDHPREAVTDLDVVVTSGPILKSPSPTIESGWLSEGAFACPLDFDSYWTCAAFEQADLLVTDDRAQFDFYKTEGYFQRTPAPGATLDEIVTERHPGRGNARDTIICINLGLALEDMATAVAIHAEAVNKGIGTILPL